MGWEEFGEYRASVRPSIDGEGLSNTVGEKASGGESERATRNEVKMKDVIEAMPGVTQESWSERWSAMPPSFSSIARDEAAEVTSRKGTTLTSRDAREELGGEEKVTTSKTSHSSSRELSHTLDGIVASRKINLPRWNDGSPTSRLSPSQPKPAVTSARIARITVQQPTDSPKTSARARPEDRTDWDGTESTDGAVPRVRDFGIGRPR